MGKSLLMITAITVLCFTDISYSASNKKRSRTAAQNRINKLIASSRKASADIRREVARLKTMKDKRIRGSDLKVAQSLSTKLSRYARLLERKRNSLGYSERDLKRDLKNVSDLSRKIQFDLQNAMQSSQQMMKTLGNILKKQNSIMSGIIKNLK
jgi:hypothetical protein